MQKKTPNGYLFSQKRGFTVGVSKLDHLGFAWTEVVVHSHGAGLEIDSDGAGANPVGVIDRHGEHRGRGPGIVASAHIVGRDACKAVACRDGVERQGMCRVIDLPLAMGQAGTADGVAGVMPVEGEMLVVSESDGERVAFLGGEGDLAVTSQLLGEFRGGFALRYGLDESVAFLLQVFCSLVLRRQRFLAHDGGNQVFPDGA